MWFLRLRRYLFLSSSFTSIHIPIHSFLSNCLSTNIKYTLANPYSFILATRIIQALDILYKSKDSPYPIPINIEGHKCQKKRDNYFDIACDIIVTKLIFSTLNIFISISSKIIIFNRLTLILIIIFIGFLSINSCL